MQANESGSGASGAAGAGNGNGARRGPNDRTDTVGDPGTGGGQGTIPPLPRPQPVIQDGTSNTVLVEPQGGSQVNPEDTGGKSNPFGESPPAGTASGQQQPAFPPPGGERQGLSERPAFVNTPGGPIPIPDAGQAVRPDPASRTRPENGEPPTTVRGGRRDDAPGSTHPNGAPDSADQTQGGHGNGGTNGGFSEEGRDRRVNLDDFNRLNDRDGDGRIDIEPVDLGGNGRARNGDNGEARGTNGEGLHDNGHAGNGGTNGSADDGRGRQVDLDDWRRLNDRDGDGRLDHFPPPTGGRPGIDLPRIDPGIRVPPGLQPPHPGPSYGDDSPPAGNRPGIVVDPIHPDVPRGGHNGGPPGFTPPPVTAPPPQMGQPPAAPPAASEPPAPAAAVTDAPSTTGPSDAPPAPDSAASPAAAEALPESPSLDVFGVAPPPAVADSTSVAAEPAAPVQRELVAAVPPPAAITEDAGETVATGDEATGFGSEIPPPGVGDAAQRKDKDPNLLEQLVDRIQDIVEDVRDLVFQSNDAPPPPPVPATLSEESALPRFEEPVDELEADPGDADRQA